MSFFCDSCHYWIEEGDGIMANDSDKVYCEECATGALGIDKPVEYVINSLPEWIQDDKDLERAE